MKGIVTYGYPPESQTTDPNQQLTIRGNHCKNFTSHQASCRRQGAFGWMAFTTWWLIRGRLFTQRCTYIYVVIYAWMDFNRCTGVTARVCMFYVLHDICIYIYIYTVHVISEICTYVETPLDIYVYTILLHAWSCMTFQSFHTLLQPGWLGHRSGLAIATAGGQTLCACEGSYESVHGLNKLQSSSLTIMFMAYTMVRIWIKSHFKSILKVFPDLILKSVFCSLGIPRKFSCLYETFYMRSILNEFPEWLLNESEMWFK